MITKRDLLEAIKDLSPDAPVVINGIVVSSVEIVAGRINADKDAYGNLRWSSTPKGKIKAILFCKFSELSTGEVMEMRI